MRTPRRGLIATAQNRSAEPPVLTCRLRARRKASCRIRQASTASPEEPGDLRTELGAPKPARVTTLRAPGVMTAKFVPRSEPRPSGSARWPCVPPKTMQTRNAPMQWNQWLAACLQRGVAAQPHDISSSETWSRAPIAGYPIAGYPIAGYPIPGHPIPGPHSRAPHSRAPHSRAPHSRAPHSRAPHFKAPHSRAPHSRAPHSRAPHSRAPHFKAPHSRAPHSRALHSRAPHCGHPLRASHSRAPHCGHPLRASHSRAPRPGHPGRRPFFSAPDLFSPPPAKIERIGSAVLLNQSGDRDGVA